MSAISSALSGIKVSNENMTIASLNIANVDTEGYARREVIQESIITAGNVQGVRIAGITTKIDKLLENALIEKISESSYAATKMHYFQAMNREFGAPGDNNSIDSYITTVFEELNTLSLNLNVPSQKIIAVDSLANLAERISYLANSLENLRYAADTELGNIVTRLNDELKKAYDLNQRTASFEKGSLEYIQSSENLKRSINTLAEFFEINQYSDDLGRLNVSTKNGVSLLGLNQVYQAKYTPSSSVDPFINNTPLNGFYITALDNNGNDTELNLIIAHPGVSGTTQNQLGSGKISALLAMRDVEIPKALNQLDILAKTIKDQFNLIHNTGSGYPPATELTSTNLVSRNQILGFSGSVRIAVVDDNGIPFANPSIPPLTLNLSTLDTGNGPGQPNLEGIINEINYHYNKRYTTENGVTMGNLNNIKLAAVTNEITPGAPFTLDLELSNYSGSSLSSQFNITSVTATDNLNNNILSSFNNTAFTISSGNTLRTGTTGPSITLANTAAPLEYPYTITVNCQVTENNTTSTAVLTFQINNPTPDPLNGVKNTRFGASSVSGQATLVPPSLGGILSATLLDDQGNTIPNNSTGVGRLNLTSAQSNYHIVVDQLDSQYLGDPVNNVLPTYEGFNSFFGLNDLFVRTDAPKNWGNLQNTSVYLSLREDIRNDPNLLSTGKLRQTNSNFPTTDPIYTYTVSSGDNATLNSMVQLGSKQFLFATASGLPSVTTSLSSYATEILSFNSVATFLIIKEAEGAGLSKEALQNKLDSIRGVNLNKELTDLILYQQIFAASAKVIQTAKELHDTLLASF